MDTYTGQTGTATSRQTDDSAQTSMQVRKRNGNLEPVDINKIVTGDHPLLCGIAIGRQPTDRDKNDKRPL